MWEHKNQKLEEYTNELVFFEEHWGVSVAYMKQKW